MENLLLLGVVVLGVVPELIAIRDAQLNIALWKDRSRPVRAAG
jgi:hypothetical protein